MTVIPHRGRGGKGMQREKQQSDGRTVPKYQLNYWPYSPSETLETVSIS